MNDDTVTVDQPELSGAPLVEGVVVEGVVVDDSQPAPADQPAPLIAGTFALYDDGQAGFVLVTETTDHGLNRRHIPAGMVKLATKLAQGGGLLGGLFR